MDSETVRALNAHTEQIDRLYGVVETLLAELQASDIPAGVNIAAGVALEELEGKPRALPMSTVALVQEHYAASWAQPLRELQERASDLLQIIELKNDLLSRAADEISQTAGLIDETYPAAAERLARLAAEMEASHA